MVAKIIGKENFKIVTLYLKRVELVTANIELCTWVTDKYKIYT